MTLPDISELNFQIGREFASCILQIIQDASLNPSDISLIGSHGQTVWHNVDEKMNVSSTLQLGDLSVIAEITGITTIGDFRCADIAVGGNGAPLTSTLDFLYLRPNIEEKRYRALQNLGGIGNVTFVSSQTDQTVAFDTGPGNVLIDWFMSYISGGQILFDNNGDFARSGHVHESLLEDMLTLPYFSFPPPKTTGRELFTIQLGEQWLQEARYKYDISDNDFACTLTELTAQSIAQAYAKYAPGDIYEIVLSGGGSKNGFLVERIAQALKSVASIPLKLHREVGLDGESKEAILFALLSYLTFKGIEGNIPTSTGAKRATVLGKIAPGINYKSLILK